MRRAISIAGLVCSVLAGCENAGKDIIAAPDYNGSISALFFIDMNGNGLPDDAEPFIPGIRISIFPGVGGTDTIGTMVSGADGRVQVQNLPLGTYHYDLDIGRAGDTLEFLDRDTTGVRLLARLDSISDSRYVALTYPRMTVRQARAAAPGKRVIIRVKVLSPLQAFHDSMAFVSDSSGTIRTTGSFHSPGRVGNELSDSVVVLGTTGTNLGQPVLSNAMFTDLVAAAPVAPKVVTVAEARTAKGGTLDGALVQILTGRISDTTIVLPNYKVIVADLNTPTDQVEMIIDQLIGVTHSLYALGKVISVIGVLVPKGDGTWVIRPRYVGDVTFP